MAFHSTIDHPNHRTRKEFRGAITMADVTACLQTTLREGAMGYWHLVDGRTATSDLSSAEIRQLATHLENIARETRIGPIVVVADRAVTFGDFRMLSAWAMDTCEIQVVYGLNEGEALLDSLQAASGK